MNQPQNNEADEKLVEIIERIISDTTVLYGVLYEMDGEFIRELIYAQAFGNRSGRSAVTEADVGALLRSIVRVLHDELGLGEEL